MNNIATHIDILEDIIEDAEGACDTWRYLGAPKVQEEFDVQFSMFIPSFNAVRRSSLIACITCLGRFADTHRKAVSLPNVVRDLKKLQWNLQALDEIEKTYSENAVNWQKIRELRNMVFAHSNKEKDERAVFAEVQITPDEISKCVSDAKGIVYRLHQENKHKDINEVFFNSIVKHDLAKLLSNLRRGRNSYIKLSGSNNLRPQDEHPNYET
jgi:hypothetical protein